MKNNKLTFGAALICATTLLTACDFEDGTSGVDGIDGEQGIAGANGTDGTNGENGNDGQNATTQLNINLVARAVLNAQSPEGAAEIVQYQQSTGLIFAVNSSGSPATVELLDLPNSSADALTKNAEGIITNTNLTTVYSLDISANTAGDANSIAISDQHELLAIAMAADTKTDNGNIAIYDISGATPSFIKNVPVGALPDMVAFSADGNKLVVANEGEPSGDYTIDPEGTISVIEISNGVVADSATSINFNSYDSEQTSLEAQGIMFANPTGRTINSVTINTTVSMDLEPEYVAISADSQTAYVSMQENNALAIVNLTDNSLEKIIGLGFKDWSEHYIDASDKDGGIHFQQYDNLYGMYQPDTIATYTWQGANFIVTANEGDGREYFFDAADEATCLSAGGIDFDDDDGCLAYTDESRVEDLDLDPIVFAGINNDDDDLGRLKVSIEKGDIDNDGDYDQLYTYGARSFTIWDQNGLVAFDSGDDVGLITAAVHGEAFNNDEDENKGDTRSDAKGAEPEALAIGEINNRTYAFIGLERMAGIMVYDITNPFNTQFIEYFHNRGSVEGEDITGDLAPEGMKFIPATDTTAARLIIGNEISGSVAVWEITLQ